METKTPCDLCGENAFQRIADRDRDSQLLDTVICMNCGLIRHAEVPSEDDLKRFYSGPTEKNTMEKERPDQDE